MTDDPLLSVRNLEKHYPVTEGVLSREVAVARAVDGVSFDIRRGETLGLVGESGCGKSTLASSLVRLEEPTGGEVIFNGGGRGPASRNPDGTHPNDVTRFDEAELKSFRRDVQLILQDPSASFDPRMSVGRSVAEPLAVHGLSDRGRRRAVVTDLLERVGLAASDFDRYPHEFSGGQKQRLALARALVLNPDLVVADEPVSALDVSVQAEILSLLADLQSAFGLSLLLITHDMSVVREVADRVAVMYLGEIVEIGPTEAVFADPGHPYTEALLSAIPTPDPRTVNRGIELAGTVPSPTDPPSGCRFHTRCHRVIQPEAYDLDQDTYRALLHFRQRVAARDIDLDSVRESVRERSSDGDASLDVAVTHELRREFELPETLPDADAERTLNTALDALLADDADRASDILAAAFTTPCEETEPEFVAHGDGHESACLRNEVGDDEDAGATDRAAGGIRAESFDDELDR